jgi:primosomal protein N' (replication factor Y)
MEKGEKNFALVLIPSPLKEPLLYSVPQKIQDNLATGMRVLVPLGGRKVSGVVLGFCAETSISGIREIIEPLDEGPILDASLLELCRWISKYYLASLGEALKTVLPSTLRVESRRIVVLRNGEAPLHNQLANEILEEVKKKRRVSVTSLVRKFSNQGVYRALDHLVSAGAIEIRERLKDSRRAEASRPVPAASDSPLDVPPKLTPTEEQEKALQSIRSRVLEGGFETFLLFGITGSGKTEVYLRAMELAARSKRQSLILVPEISLTPQLLDRLRERFPDKVGVLHSALTPRERWAEWWRILHGEVAVVVGARSAVFAPLRDLGLIVVDEEHDPSYKQEEGLRYHARDVAVVRGKLAGCTVLLGSATPSVESFENSRRGRYRLLQLTKRVEKRSLPQIEVVDLKQEWGGERREARGHSEAFRLFSSSLVEALQDNQARGQQSLIFLNRRGFANFLQCRLCGFVLRCPHCTVTLTFHLKLRRAICHHCGFRKPAADLCFGCGQRSLSPVGFGTEQIEQELCRLMPEARVGRMDRDTTRQRGSQDRLIRQWERGEIDVLVGTQMITKGHDVAGVTLVGVLLADLSLNLPDFRAAERTFQLLTQVAGRAGRGNEPGRVVVQTYAPDHYAVEYAAAHDYERFFASEIEFRRALNYPPFSRLVHLRLEGPRAEEVEAKAVRLGEALRQEHKPGVKTHGQIEILGPAPAPIEKLRGRYRWQILLKGEKSASLLERANQARAILPRSRSVRLHVDVDPYSML